MDASCHLTGAVVITRSDGLVAWWTPAAEARFGWPATEAVGRQLWDLLGDTDPTAFTAKLREASQAQGVPLKVRIRGLSGETMEMVLRSFPMADEAGGLYGFVHLFTSSARSAGISSGAHSDACIPRLRDTLHELNNIFASVHSSLDMALAVPDPAQARNFVVEAQSSARRGALTVNRFRAEAKDAATQNPAPHPDSKSQTEQASTPAARVMPTESQSLEGNERILLVDDDQPLRMLMKAVLAYRGYQVIEAGDGIEALEVYKKSGPFKLVILDGRMPRMGGMETMKELRRLDPGLKTILLSGSLSDKEERVVYEGGFDLFIQKPFSNMDLVRSVRKLLDKIP
jgi:CheY-like chemotaxis protein